MEQRCPLITYDGHRCLGLIQSWPSAKDRQGCRAVRGLDVFQSCRLPIRLEYLSEDENPPLVHSLSYGDEEPEIFNASIPGAIDYARRIDLEFLKFGLRGESVGGGGGGGGGNGAAAHTSVSTGVLIGMKSLTFWPLLLPLLAVSGLTIVTASGDDGASAPFCHKAWPSWPSTSPYITVVGATQLTTRYLPAFDR